MRDAYFPGQSSPAMAATLGNGGPHMNPYYGLPGQQAVLPPRSPVIPVIPPGLHALYTACRAVYPDQVNPLQVAAVTKYWLGGPDPLDYVTMFANPGDSEKNIPPHWHYVSFGLSDLHGDGRVHQVTPLDSPSGFGFELTFRLTREPEDVSPPTWPTAVMQALAKYVFQSENALCPGDHVSWHCSLDNSDSRIQHMLMTEDAQLGTVLTPFGTVTFVQIVGVTLEELQAAQQWNGPGLIDLMKGIDGVGGDWLVTDMRRGESMFDLDPEIKEAVEDGIAAEGSNLSGVTAKCSWCEKMADVDETADEDDGKVNEKSKDEPAKASLNTPIVSSGHEDNEQPSGALSPISALSRTSRHSAMSIAREETENLSQSRMSIGAAAVELMETKFLESLHLTLNNEAGSLLPLALKGRLKHGRHFTFKTVQGDIAITLLTESVSGSQATIENRFALHGPWLQVLIPSESLENVISQISELQNLDGVNLPKTYVFKNLKLSITIVVDEN
ncbi:Suppressor of fused -like protein [Halotydeus destructor]|nr:Suppressor of fused -like protein [Halotydeus destructor]